MQTWLTSMALKTSLDRSSAIEAQGLAINANSSTISAALVPKTRQHENSKDRLPVRDLPYRVEHGVVPDSHFVIRILAFRSDSRN